MTYVFAYLFGFIEKSTLKIDVNDLLNLTSCENYAIITLEIILDVSLTAFRK